MGNHNIIEAYNYFRSLQECGGKYLKGTPSRYIYLIVGFSKGQGSRQKAIPKYFDSYSAIRRFVSNLGIIFHERFHNKVGGIHGLAVKILRQFAWTICMDDLTECCDSVIAPCSPPPHLPLNTVACISWWMSLRVFSQIFKRSNQLLFARVKSNFAVYSADLRQICAVKFPRYQ